MNSVALNPNSTSLYKSLSEIDDKPLKEQLCADQAIEQMVSALNHYNTARNTDIIKFAVSEKRERIVVAVQRSEAWQKEAVKTPKGFNELLELLLPDEVGYWLDEDGNSLLEHAAMVGSVDNFDYLISHKLQFNTVQADTGACATTNQRIGENHR